MEKIRNKDKQPKDSEILNLKISKYINLIFLFFIYGSIINLIYNDLSIIVSLFFVFSVFTFGALRYSNWIILFPFIIYPFMFVIRAQDPDYIFLKILPDIFTILAIVSHFMKSGITTRHYNIILLLMFKK